MKKILLIVILIFPFLSLYGAMIRTPYLQAVTQNSVYVMIECDSSDDVTVQYGLTTLYGNNAVTESVLQPTSGKWMHRIRLTGLSAGEEYHYRATQDGLNYTSDYVFRTAVSYGTSFRMAITGDMRSNPTVWNKIAGHIISHNPAFMVLTGDLCYDGSYSSWNDEFFTANNMILSASVPWFNSLGNHEAWTTATQAFIKNPDSDSGNETYYSFDYGDFHFAVMNNYGAVSYDVGSNQANWIYGDLTTTSKPWKVAVFHVHGFGASSGHGEDAAMIDITTNVFEPAGVAFTLAGHSHMFQYNKVNDCYHFIIGGGGAPLHIPTPMPYTFFSSSSWGYTIADCSSCEFNLIQYDVNATPISTVIINRCSSTPTPIFTFVPTPTLTISEKIIVYPNPFFYSKHKKIIFPKTKNGSTISIYTLNGELVMRKNVLNTKYEWTPDLAPGIYVYIIKNNDTITRGKICIVR